MVIRKVTRQELTESIPEQTIPTVSELTRQVTEQLESRFDSVVVQGEISGWSRAASGHTYFTLKDERASLGAVLWRGRTLQHPIRDGMKVIASGRITVYAPRGQYQLDCMTIVPLGQGDLQIAFEKLKRKLQEEGLFDAERKRPIPAFPLKIGLVTSRDGAALRDIVTTVRRRMPIVRLVLRSALVQGATAAEEIALAIAQLNEYEDIDLLIVGRGGGSAEDLWAFNEEVVARAIAASRIPVISAVGHEIDFSIADFVADLRAPTPTAAAEIATRDRSEVIAMLLGIEDRLSSGLVDHLAQLRRELASLEKSRGLSRPLDMVRSHAQRVDDLAHRNSLGLRSALQHARERLGIHEAKLDALNPANVLARGFAIIQKDGQPVTARAGLAAGDRIDITMHDGVVGAKVEENTGVSSQKSE
jgi:exodeoxyribonuclease VII large subunit